MIEARSPGLTARARFSKSPGSAAAMVLPRAMTSDRLTTPCGPSSSMRMKWWTLRSSARTASTLSQRSRLEQTTIRASESLMMYLTCSGMSEV